MLFQHSQIQIPLMEVYRETNSSTCDFTTASFYLILAKVFVLCAWVRVLSKYTSSTGQNLSHCCNRKMKLIKLVSRVFRSVSRRFAGRNLTRVNSVSHWVLRNKGHSQRLLVRTALLILSDNRALGESFSTTLPVFLFHATYINRTLPRGATQTLGQSLPSMSRALTTH